MVRLNGERRFALLFLGVVGLLALAFYRKFAFDPSLMLGAGGGVSDMLEQAYQLRKFAIDELRAGRGFPLWNPFVYGGLPYLSVLPGPVFYPSSLLYLVMPLSRAIGWTFVLHTALAGAFAWLAARSLGLGTWASATAGLAFMFTGFVVSTLYGGHDGRMFAMVLIPVAFALLERGLDSGKVGWFLGLGLVVASQIFTPHVQLMYFSSLALGLYALLRIVERWKREGDYHGALRLFGYLVLAFVIAAAVGSVQLLPTIQILEVAVRGGTGEAGYEFASSYALPAQEISAIFLPDLIGSMETYWGSNPIKFHTEYAGGVTLAFALLALTRIRSDRRVLYLAGIALLCLLFALGDATPVHRVMYEVVPFIKRFRAPSMMLAPAALFVALLAGIGVQSILDARAGGGPVKWTLAWALSAPILLLGLAAALSPEGLIRWAYHSWYPAGWMRSGPPELASQLRLNGWLLLIGWGAALGVGQAITSKRLPTAALLAVLALLVVDLWRVDTRYLDTVDPEQYYASDDLIATMKLGIRPGERVFPTTYGRNELMYYGIPSVTGMQNFRLKWFERLVGGLSYDNLVARPVLWGLFDLRYITSSSPVETPFLREVDRNETAILYEPTADVAHAWFPGHVRIVSDNLEAVSATLDLLNPWESSVVESVEPIPAGAGVVTVRSSEPNEIVLDATVEISGLLFLSEIYYPAWEAFIDGEEVEILRTNGAFRGVVVPEGEHEVRFRYSSTEFTTAFVISASSLAATLLALLIIGVRSRTRDRV
jgi:hypothetical protein